MARPLTIVGLGEALFDVFPEYQVLGGAPLNAAVHAHQLASVVGGSGAMVSRVGRDELGQRILVELEVRGMSTRYVQRDAEHETGQVHVTIVDGEPHYDIVAGVAWDRMEFTPDCAELAGRCGAVCFGSLAQRDPVSRACIEQFVRTADDAVRMFDVNLRQQYFSAEIIRRSCELANVVKLNDQELPIVAELLGISGDDPDSQARALLAAFGLDAVALTRGPLGTVLFTPQERFEGDAVSYPLAENADNVGAGDACSAGLLFGMLRGLPWPQTLQLANHAGAYVASQCGATPSLPAEVLRRAGESLG